MSDGLQIRIAWSKWQIWALLALFVGAGVFGGWVAHVFGCGAEVSPASKRTESQPAGAGEDIRTEATRPDHAIDELQKTLNESKRELMDRIEKLDARINTDAASRASPPNPAGPAAAEWHAQIEELKKEIKNLDGIFARRTMVEAKGNELDKAKEEIEQLKTRVEKLEGKPVKEMGTQ